MRFKLELQKNSNRNNYYSFTFIEMAFINTCQLWSINITLFNVFLQILEKKLNPKVDIKYIKSVPLSVEQKELCYKLRCETHMGLLQCKRHLIANNWNYKEAKENFSIQTR